MKKLTEYGIIGGGILGMSVANNLSKQGYKVTVIEAAPKAGGLAGSERIGGYIWDRFYHVILLSDTNTRQLIHELHLDNLVHWVKTQTGFYTKNGLYPFSGAMDYLKFSPLNLYEKFRLGITILYASRIKNWKKLEAIPIEEWLIKVSGKTTYKKIWEPLLRAKLGDEYQRTSAAFIWATIQRMYAARRSGLKNEMFGYVEGGYEKVLKKFYDKLTEQQVNFRFNVIVNKIEKNKNKVEVQSDKGETLCFDKVICALPSSIAANIVMGLNEEEQKAHKSIEYMGVICPSFLLKKPLTPYYITNITDSTIPFTGIIEMTALVDKDTFDGNNLIYLPKYLKSSDNLFNINESEIIDYFFSNLQKMYPQLNKEDIIASNLAKSRNVFALNTLNYSKKLPAVTTSVEGVFILNSAQIVNGTLNINESIQLSEKFLSQIIDA